MNQPNPPSQPSPQNPETNPGPNPTESSAQPPNKIIAALASDIKLSHSIFAMPFALLATFLAAGANFRYPTLAEFILIITCMFFARTFAMLANRYLDRHIDAHNPRTKNRALPSGRLKPAHVLLAITLNIVLFIATTSAFGIISQNWWPTILAPAVLLWIGTYGLIKRFSLLCHFFLGAALAISPLAAGIAIYPDTLQQPTLWWLSGFVLLWVAGFDIIYALQDIDCDKRDGLHSIPAKLGQPLALFIAKLAHLAAIIMLVMTDQSSPLLGKYFAAGMIAVGILLTIEHYLAARAKFSMAFFTLNGIISIILGTLGIIDITLKLNS